MEERGIVYLSRIPPYMGKTKLRRIFSKHGDIDRTYFTLEPRINRVRRIKDGGTKKKCFTEGWIEFLRKQDAKRVAALYNNAPTGGKKRHNFYREDLWCIRYLPKFTWTHLEHKIEMDKHVAESEVRNEVTLARKANKFHTKQVNKARYLEKRQKLEEHPQYSYIQKTPIPEQDQVQGLIQKMRNSVCSITQNDALETVGGHYKYQIYLTFVISFLYAQAGY